jgi:hypothetical protein
MWIVTAICSSPACEAEDEFVVATLDEAESVACECGCCFVTLAIASFEPVHGRVAIG